MTASAEYDLIIIGGGIAGLSTAIWGRRVGLSVLVLEQTAEAGGQLRAIAQPIVDLPGLLPESGPALAARVRDQALAAGAIISPRTQVLAVDVARRTCLTPTGELRAGALVMATGLSPRRLGLPGEAELARRGLLHRPSHDLAWFAGRRVAVVGGGDRAAENALLLAAVARHVTLIHRGPALRARPEFADRISLSDRIALLLATTITDLTVLPDDTLTLDLRSDAGAERLPFDACCIYIGNEPNSALVGGQVALTPDGYVITDRYGLSSRPGLYAVGDVCTQPAFQSLAVAAGQAMVVAKHAALQRP